MPETAVPATDRTHSFAVTVYWEDTDAAGIVYYANYLKFMERARSELVTAAGIDQTALLDREGIVFPVRRCCIDYLQPARLGDSLTVTTAVKHVGGASIDMHQAVHCSGRTLAEAEIRLACIGPDGRPKRLPLEVRQALARA